MRVLAALLLLLLDVGSASRLSREQVYDPFVTDLNAFGSAPEPSNAANGLDPDLHALLANMVRILMTCELKECSVD